MNIIGNVSVNFNHLKASTAVVSFCPWTFYKTAISNCGQSGVAVSRLAM